MSKEVVNAGKIAIIKINTKNKKYIVSNCVTTVLVSLSYC